MQVKRMQSEDETIEELRQQIAELRAEHLLLQEQLASREQFTALIAHELGGPLTPIINYAKIVARPNQKPETIVRGTDIIIGQARRLARLVKDLQDESRLSTGKFTLTRSSCEVISLANEAVEQLRAIAPHNTFVVNAPETPISGNWDCVRLEQALGNLLDNAIKYSDDGTPITVQISSEQNWVHISVHNFGTSIPDADSGLLFRPYVRLQGSTGHQGSGLGLYITRCIVEAHGGLLRLEPHTAEGQGTTFSFDLPL